MSDDEFDVSGLFPMTDIVPTDESMDEEGMLEDNTDLLRLKEEVSRIVMANLSDEERLEETRDAVLDLKRVAEDQGIGLEHIPLLFEIKLSAFDFNQGLEAWLQMNFDLI